MAITLHATVIANARMEHKTFEIPADGLTSVKDLLDRADRDKLMGRRFFKKLMGRRKMCAITVLHNGARLDLPADLEGAVADGDEVTIMTPTVGG